MPFPVKGKIPEYPRPVPEVCTDEIPICANTIIYNDLIDHDEEGDDRAIKRRKRIEQYAHSYLRGESIFILSAQLRGPLDKGWRNPWQKKSMKEITLPEIPETSLRDGRHVSNVKMSTQAGVANSSKRKADDDSPFSKRKRLTSPFRPLSKERLPAIGKAPSSTKRVEDWLKRNDDYPRRRLNDNIGSPTPSAAHTTLSKGKTEPGSSAQIEHAIDTAKELHKAVDDPNAKSDSIERITSSVVGEDEARTTIKNENLRSVHRIPPSTNLPEFEYRRVDRKISPSSTRKVIEEQAEGLQQQEDRRSAIAPGLAALRRSNAQLHTETSKASTISNLPSAQPVQIARANSTISNLANTGNMLEELPPLQKSRTIEEDLPTINHEQLAMTAQKAYDQLQQMPMKTPLLSTASKEMNTQQLLDGIIPLDFSTIKRPTNGSIDQGSPPTTVLKTKSSKKKRVTIGPDSFSSTSSRGSLKISMKVKKTNDKPESHEKAKLKTVEEDADENLVSDLVNSSPLPSSLHRTKSSAVPKGILKSSMTLSSWAAPTSNNTSSKQDAQRVVGQFPGVPADESGVNDDGFDLGGAISELESFLGTWDPEKEASGLMT